MLRTPPSHKPHHLLPLFLHQLPHTLTTLHPSHTHSQATQISTLILKTSSTPQTLTKTLQTLEISWSPDLVNRILKRLWNHGPKALAFFNCLDSRRPIAYDHTASSFDHAIDIAGRLRDYKALWNLLRRMRVRHVEPTARTFAIISERYVAAGKAHRAVKLFLTMHEHGCLQSLHSFNTLLDVLCKSKRVEMAHSIFRALKSKFRADVVSYNIMSNGWCLIKRTPKALETLKEMVEVGLNPTLVTYNILLKGFFRASQTKEAWEFFIQMKKRGVNPDVVTYTTVIHGFGVLGEVDKARKVFGQMVGDGCLPSVATYNALIQVLCKKDSVENAVLVFDDMVRKGYTPNVTTCNVLIRGLCHAEKFDLAMKFMEKMKGDDECEPNVQTYNVMIRYLCEAGDIERGFDVFAKMEGGDCLPNLDTYNILISSMFVRKKEEDVLAAGKLLMEMVERGFVPRRFNFNRIVNGLLLTGNQGFAKEILRVQSKCRRLPREFRL